MPTDTTIATAVTISSANTGLRFRNPLWTKASAKKKEPNAPAMNTSPCAKLIMRRIPYTSP